LIFIKNEKFAKNLNFITTREKLYNTKKVINIEKTTAVIKDLKPNGFVMLDGVPCRVEKVQISTSGKY
jgi:hypothetical protein